jgi:hypothetical protein
MHAEPVQATRASMIAELCGDRPPRLWVAAGHPCETEFSEVSF